MYMVKEKFRIFVGRVHSIKGTKQMLKKERKRCAGCGKAPLLYNKNTFASFSLVPQLHPLFD
jgi:hypothetical protein